MSPFQTSSLLTPPAGIPGPRMMSGTRDGRVIGQVLAVRDPVLSAEEPVVGGEDDVGVVEDALVLQGWTSSPTD